MACWYASSPTNFRSSGTSTRALSSSSSDLWARSKGSRNASAKATSRTLALAVRALYAAPGATPAATHQGHPDDIAAAACADRLRANPVATATAEDVFKNSRREDRGSCIDFEFAFMSSSFS